MADHGSAQLELDLFASVMSSTQQHQVDALTCLRDSMDDALEIVTSLRYGRTEDTRSPRVSGEWAYCVSRAGLRFECVHEWWSGARRRGEAWGWNRTPAKLATWDQLTAWIGADPRRVEITAWVESLPAPRWRLVTRPHELWPDAESGHISHICHDHLHVQWPARRRAWELTLALLSDAIKAVEMVGVNE